MSVTLEERSAPQVGLGDPETWVEQHGDALLRYVLARVSDRATAEDLVQEALLSAWRGREGFKGECTPRTWLVSILKRRVADHFRRVGRLPASQETLDAADPRVDRHAMPSAERASQDSEFWAIVTSCTSDLPEHLARAFRLRTFGDAQPEVICDSEGISRKNLSVRLHRARQLLRRCLEARWFASEPAETHGK